MKKIVRYYYTIVTVYHLWKFKNKMKRYPFLEVLVLVEKLIQVRENKKEKRV